MTDPQHRAVAAIALLAAFADGRSDDRERAAIQRVAQTLDEGADGALPMAGLHRDVLLGRLSMEAAAADLPTRELRLLAYEFAVGVVEADGLRDAAETAFLARLATALGLESDATAPVLATGDALATVPLASEATGAAAGDDGGAASSGRGDSPASPAEVDPPTPSAVDAEAIAAAEVAGGKIDIGTADSGRLAVPGAAAGASPEADPKAAELDRAILNAAILNGALELLPQSLASMAIIPLQMKLVHRIGQSYGYTLDRGQVKELLATLGAGVTGQYLEDVGRKLLGGLFGKAGGRLLGGLARNATGMAFSFATTWAIGQVARRYYAGGRTMSTDALKATFTSLTDEARALQTRYLPQIEERSRRIDTTQLLSLVRGN